MLKYSKQRDCILKFMQNRHDHPTAETVYQNVRQELPNISLGTVYRNLNLLVELGQLRRISSGEGPDRYDCRLSPHNHFTCDRCGQMLDLDIELNENIYDLAPKAFEGQIKEHTILFQGICPECLKKEQEKAGVDAV